MKFKNGFFWFNSFLLLSLLFSAWAVWSYSLTDPNLVLISWPPYWRWQQVAWNWGKDRQALIFCLSWLLFFLNGAYLWFVFNCWRQRKLALKRLLFGWLAIVVVLFFSYNAFSHDVFNYLFNAKMAVVYHADPHRQVALDFAFDPWTRFMHNTHTPAPYGRGWTWISLLPFYLGQSRFLLTWLSFRFFNLSALVLALITLWRSQKASKWQVLALAFHPFILLEFVGNIHNDFWMIWPALLSLLFLNDLLGGQKKARIILISLLSFFSLLFSIYIKLATIVILPLWLILFLAIIIQRYRHLPPKLKNFLLLFWPLAASISLFTPLLSPRSQQFHPWYLAWSLVWLPLFASRRQVRQQLGKGRLSQVAFYGQKIIWWSLAGESLIILYRYLPFLLKNNYDEVVIWQEKMITWLPLAIITAIAFLKIIGRKIYAKK